MAPALPLMVLPTLNHLFVRREGEEKAYSDFPPLQQSQGRSHTAVLPPRQKPAYTGRRLAAVGGGQPTMQVSCRSNSALAKLFTKNTPSTP
eukprot:357482-Chlamydomonas_euryale.AAC.1